MRGTVQPPEEFSVLVEEISRLTEGALMFVGEERESLMFRWADVQMPTGIGLKMLRGRDPVEAAQDIVNNILNHDDVRGFAAMFGAPAREIDA